MILMTGIDHCFFFSVASGLLGDMLKAERFVLERVKSLGGNKKKKAKTIDC